MLPTKSLRCVNALQVMIAVCGLQLYAQSLDPRWPVDWAARARAAAAQRLRAQADSSVQIPTAPGTFITFDPPGSFFTSTSGINPAGATAGWYGDGKSQHGYVRDKQGTFTTFNPPNPKDSINVSGPNPAGVVTGNYIESGGLAHGFVWARGTFTAFDAPGESTSGNGINPAGLVVGGYLSTPDFVFHGFLRAADGTITTIDDPSAGTGSFEGTNGVAINPAGAITGYYFVAGQAPQGFLRTPDGTFTNFAVPGPVQGTFPGAINPNGTIIGFYYAADGVTNGFVRASDGALTTLSIPGAVGTGAGAINPNGTITGTILTQMECCTVSGAIETAPSRISIRRAQLSPSSEASTRRGRSLGIILT